MTQLSSWPSGLDAKIEKEIESNEGSTVYSDRKVRLFYCIARKISVKRSDEHEEK